MTYPGEPRPHCEWAGSCWEPRELLLLWKNCPHGGVWLCGRHAARVRNSEIQVICALGCGGLPRPDKSLSLYDGYRHLWLTDGGLINKDRLIDAVTLQVPAEWEPFGSILKPEPAPAAPAKRRAVGDMTLRELCGPASIISFWLAACGFFGGLIWIIVSVLIGSVHFH